MDRMSAAAQNSDVEIPNHKVRVIEGVDFLGGGELLGHEHGVLMSGMSAHKKGTPETTLPHFTRRGYNKKWTACNLEERFLQDMAIQTS